MNLGTLEADYCQSLCIFFFFFRILKQLLEVTCWLTGSDASTWLNMRVSAPTPRTSYDAGE